MNNTENQTVTRKHSHVEICLHADVGFSGKSAGFDRIELEHNAVPEINFDEIDLSTTFLGRRIGYPLMISSMTGGYEEAGRLNRTIAETAERLQIPLGVGSMRQALENSDYRETFSIVRSMAPSVPVLANIGAPEVARGLSREELMLLTDIIDADALIVHLNPAQELFQPEGSTMFRNLLDELRRITRMLEVPVVAKEVGCGISASAARRLVEAGVTIIDVAGAGGLSWQKVEEVRYLRQFGEDTRFSPGAIDELLDWGIPTARCLVDIAGLKHTDPSCKDMTVIASGGIRNGIDIAKAIALGADLAASAGALLKALHQERLEETILTWMNDLKAAMFLTGSATIDELRKTRTFLKQG
ncbi:type 2 isopentenyl-diphosphate Delta-isomerase [Prosthecochloris sp. HL-130-GSB]|jgi:isopentenyl-diphosphate Delta-isomerase|nr:type 2 isopentenyl-diphosphate Delta-isomerase [Prosthecochloris sp. HL-130-GSB]ARM30293.1 type 2 isopentenyl-diphosphate Delta-isomerase [Prosthecochloris sp. HL-130-GSB]